MLCRQHDADVKEVGCEAYLAGEHEFASFMHTHGLAVVKTAIAIPQLAALNRNIQQTVDGLVAKQMMSSLPGESVFHTFGIGPDGETLLESEGDERYTMMVPSKLRMQVMADKALKGNWLSTESKQTLRSVLSSTTVVLSRVWRGMSQQSASILYNAPPQDKVGTQAHHIDVHPDQIAFVALTALDDFCIYVSPGSHRLIAALEDAPPGTEHRLVDSYGQSKSIRLVLKPGYTLFMDCTLVHAGANGKSGSVSGRVHQYFNHITHVKALKAAANKSLSQTQKKAAAVHAVRTAEGARVCVARMHEQVGSMLCEVADGLSSIEHTDDVEAEVSRVLDSWYLNAKATVIASIRDRVNSITDAIVPTANVKLTTSLAILSNASSHALVNQFPALPGHQLHGPPDADP